MNMRPGETQFFEWQRAKKKKISKSLVELSNQGYDGAVTSMELLHFVKALQALGSKNTWACPETGFPVVFHEAGLEVFGYRYRLYTSFIGTKGILLSLESYAMGDKQEKQVQNGNALLKAETWIRTCPIDRGRPWLIRFDDYRSKYLNEEERGIVRRIVKAVE